MATIKILLEGYLEEERGGTRPTVTLVKDKDVVMVVDPGTMESQDILLHALKENGLTKEDINVVCITHSHIDHYKNIGMFPRAKALDFWGLWDGDQDEELKENFTDDIRIIKTPGHDKTGITLLVTTDKGTVAICGDVFWKKDFPEDDPYADDKEKLEQSRHLILKSADYIIPGHGEMFRSS
ncbi:MAG: MBL fold metallo-hydrolase [bacterium]|nr:MBL fold metallo-hydrolase [bacterium]